MFLRVAVVLWALTMSAILLPQQQLKSSLGAGTWRWVRDWDYDGKKILGHIGNDIHLWDAQTGRLIHRFVGHREGIRSVRFSPDGKYALTDSWMNSLGGCYNQQQYRSKDTSVRLWSLESGKPVWEIEGHVAGAFSPDGQRLLTFPLLDPLNGCGGAGGTGLAMWDVATRRQLFVVKFEAHTEGQTLGFSSDGRTFMYFRDPVVSVYDAGNGTPIGKLNGINAASFSGPDGDIATTPHSNDRFELWDSMLTTRKRQTPMGDSATWIDWTPDGTRLFGVSPGCRSMLVWAVDSGRKLSQPACDRDISVISGSVLASPDNKRLLLLLGGLVSNTNHLNPTMLGLFDLDSGAELAQIASRGLPIGFSPDGETFLVGGASADGSWALHLDSFRVYRSDSGKPVVTLDLEQGRIR